MIKVLHKALNILETVASSDDGMTLGEIAAAIDEKSTTASNIVQVLYKRNYLEKLPGKGGYRLGSSAYMLGDVNGGRYGDTLRKAAVGVLTRLTEATDAKSVLTVWRNGDRQVLLRIEDDSPITVNDNYKMTTVYQNVTGMLMLACRDEETIREYVRKHGMPSPEEMKAESIEELLEKLDGLRRAGFYSRTRRQIFEAAAMVQQGNANPDTAIGLFMPAFRAGDRDEISERLMYAAKELSERLSEAR